MLELIPSLYTGSPRQGSHRGGAGRAFAAMRSPSSSCRRYQSSISLPNLIVLVLMTCDLILELVRYDIVGRLHDFGDNSSVIQQRDILHILSQISRVVSYLYYFCVQ
jgi:hypothetical protein